MNVIRVEKNKDYSVISNGFLRDKALSYKAKGLLANIMTHSAEYEFSINGVVATSKEDKKAIYSAITELIENGYAKREQARNGKFAGKVTYTFYEKPCLNKTEQLSRFEDAENEQAENAPQRNTNNKEITNIRNNMFNAAPPHEIEIPDFFNQPEDLYEKTKLSCGGVRGSKEWKTEKFEIFWEAYKKKKGKGPALAKWMRLTADEIDKALLCVEDHVIITPDYQYRRLPITWISQKGWEDDISVELKRYKPANYKKETTASTYDENSY